MLSALSEQQLQELTTIAENWPEIRKRRIIAKSQQKIVVLVELFCQPEVARKEAAEITEEGLDGFLSA